MESFSDYTQLVLARMQTNPEEFMHYSPRGRWETLIEALQEVARGGRYGALWALSKEEVDVLLATYRTIYLKDMHKHMLEQIVSGDALEPRYIDKRKLIEEYEKGQTVNDSPNYNRF
jgi:hypothetical protein